MDNFFETEYVKFCRSKLQEKYDYYIFISRKCFYYTKFVSDKYGFSIPVDSLRDRDILKGVNLSALKDKELLLIDDTFHSGETIANVLKCFPNTEERPKIDIAVFCLTPKGLENLKTRQELQVCGKKSYCKIFSEDMMSRMTLLELQTIQQSMYPYVIDLPVFNETEIPYSTFELLTDELKFGWEFHEYTVELGNRIYQNGFFSYKNQFLEEKLGNSLHDIVVKCRYRIEENEGGLKVKCVFVPFVMLRSVSYEKMREVCRNLFKGTTYDSMLGGYDPVVSESSEKYIAVYRSVVYVLSYLVGKLFYNYIRFAFDIDLQLVKNLSSWLPNEQFGESVDQIFDDFDLEDFKTRLIEFSGEACVPKVQSEKQTGKMEGTTREIINYVMGGLSLQKSRMGHEAGDKGQRFISQENLEEIIAERFDFRSYSHFQTETTRTLLKLLDSGFLSNSLQLAENKIERGFRLGETSSFLFGYKIKTFYAGIYAYYNVVGMSPDKYKENYELFINVFYRFLLVNEYFERDFITENGFEYFKMYFNLDEDVLQREIGNKRFLLAYNLQDEEKSICEIFNFIYNLEEFRGE